MGVQGGGYAGLHVELGKRATGNDTFLVDKNITESNKVQHKEQIIGPGMNK